jgi:hypothetical protein
MEDATRAIQYPKPLSRSTYSIVQHASEEGEALLPILSGKERANEMNPLSRVEVDKGEEEKELPQRRHSLQSTESSVSWDDKQERLAGPT